LCKIDRVFTVFFVPKDTDNRTMKLRCQACGFENDIKKDTQIYARQYVARTQDMPVDLDLQYDHTLTRTSQVPCLNDKCPTNQENGPPREVATYQYNSESGKLGYICVVCHHYWKNL
jgi:DNA-directed RNA polymerase subunit M/transcription elongation factor TFIIS